MKNIVYTILLFTVGYSQVDSLAISFYPAEIGNLWQYRDYYHSYWSGSSTSYYSIEVVGDTIDATTGQRSMIFEREDSQYPIYIDSVTTAVYRSGIQIYQLNSQAGDTVLGWNHANTWDAFLLGCSTTVKYYSQMTGNEQRSYRLASGLGFLQYNYSEPEISSSLTLVYARINGFEFGSFTSVASDFNNEPSTNRVLNAYPNPFNGELHVQLGNEVNNIATLSIINISGQIVGDLSSSIQNLGDNKYIWRSSNQPTGVYVVVAKINTGQHLTKKVVLLK